MAEEEMQKHNNANAEDEEAEDEFKISIKGPDFSTPVEVDKDNSRHESSDNLPQAVVNDDHLDAEVQGCLSGFPSYISKMNSSPSSCSFYSSCTLPGGGSEVDTMSSCSFYSTRTVRDTDTDGASYCSAGTMVGDSEEEEEERKDEDVTRTGDTVQQVALEDTVTDSVEDIRRYDDGCGNNIDREEARSQHYMPSSDTLAWSSYVADSCLSENSGAAPSLASEGEVSLAGHVNERLGRLLGYDGEGGQPIDLEDAAAKIMGYEIVGSKNDTHTVSSPASTIISCILHVDKSN